MARGKRPPAATGDAGWAARRGLDPLGMPGMRGNEVGMKRKQAEGPSRRDALIDSLSLPKDILLGALRVTLTGSQEAWVENYKGILEYTECQILLQGKNCQVCFEGQRLCIEYYTNEDMKISGCIRCVRYQ